MRAFLLTLCLAAPLVAQRGAVDARGTIGWTTFLDESSQSHLFTGGAVRYYLTDRFSVEPEVFFLYKDETDKDVGFQANVAYDFARRGSRVVPYVIGGVGVLKTYLKFGPSRFDTTEAVVSGGGGAKIYLNDRWFVAPEARLGLETIARVTVSLGYSWR